MTKSILRYFIVVLVITLLSTCILSTAFLSHILLERTKQDMFYSLRLMNYAIDINQPLVNQIDQLNPLAYSSQSRISIIDKEGNVLVDTDDRQVSQNHLDRQEISDALLYGEGTSSRYSVTTKTNMLYVAYYDGNYILRLSIPYNGLIDELPVLIPALSMSAIGSFIIAFLLSRRLAYKISKPIIEISESLDHMSNDFYFHLKDYDYQEFQVIVDTLHNLSHKLRKSMREVKLEQIKIDEILKQMNEGFVLLDENYKILSINQQAISLLGQMQLYDKFTDKINNPNILDALNNHISKQMIELHIDHNVYACYISIIDLGTTLLFLDITANKKAEKIRSEFFSNVSHELKTPMTSIRGYSEILSQGIVKDQQQEKEMLSKIQNEVQNMSTLINDILMLSRLESKDIKIDISQLNVKKIMNNVLESYEAEISLHHLEVSLDIEDMIFKGNDYHIFTLFSNIVGNAVKYNVDNGKIMISLHAENHAMKLTVKDTGIGIPLSDQTRVFERFYRVDKGRSRQRGGTGLGLAIVKHIVSFYQGTISLTSELNQGTEIEVIILEQ